MAYEQQCDGARREDSARSWRYNGSCARAAVQGRTVNDDGVVVISDGASSAQGTPSSAKGSVAPSPPPMTKGGDIDGGSIGAPATGVSCISSASGVNGLPTQTRLAEESGARGERVGFAGGLLRNSLSTAATSASAASSSCATAQAIAASLSTCMATASRSLNNCCNPSACAAVTPNTPSPSCKEGGTSLAPPNCVAPVAPTPPSCATQSPAGRGEGRGGGERVRGEGEGRG